MKLIRNRKMLQAKRRRYSHLMESFRATIKEGAQEMSKRDAMIDWLAKLIDELANDAPPEAPCTDGQSCPPESKADCAWCWKQAAEKAVQDADRS